MWTNVFKIGGLHQISWFQFLPHAPDLAQLDKCVRLDQKDATMYLVLSSHLQLQKEGFLCTWTNSFIGPWDPSQGMYNPDEKVKLWLFLPGRHSSVVETAQAAVSKLRVVASGLWLAPGDSEEVATALSQALRNCIERALIGLSYLRFGDVFTRCQPLSQSEELFRRGQPIVEFVFAATEEAIFVHVMISAKHVRALSSCDMEAVLRQPLSNSDEGLPVIVSPHGLQGRLTGFCPNDLVKQVYFSSENFRTSDGLVGFPYHAFQGLNCLLRGQSYYFEVSFGLTHTGSDKATLRYSNTIRNFQKKNMAKSPAVRGDLEKISGIQDSICEKALIFPVEAVLVPVLRTSFASSSLKRFWLQNWIGKSLSNSSFFLQSAGMPDLMDSSCIVPNGVRRQYGYNSSSNSNSSSISSISSDSSDSDFKMTSEAGELDADGDSLTCRQSDLTSNEHTLADTSRPGIKRSRGMAEALGHGGTVSNAPAHTTVRPGIHYAEVNNSAVTRVTNEQIGSHWGWDDDDQGIVMDIQTLLSEFGDFGDFFENDVLPFGEPPGTAESQAHMFSAPDEGDVGSSLCTGVIDVSDQMLLPAGFPIFESIKPHAAMEEYIAKNQEPTYSEVASTLVNCISSSFSSEFDYLMKAEAVMTFAPEYGAVNMPRNEFSSSIFISPYFPKSRKAGTSSSSPYNYVYCAAPPSFHYFNGSKEKPGMSASSKAYHGRHDKNAILCSKKGYTCMESVQEKYGGKSVLVNSTVVSHDGTMPTPLSCFRSTGTVNSSQRKIADSTVGAENFLLYMRKALATELECIMLQASMCRIRHTIFSASSSLLIGSKFTGSSCSTQMPADDSTMTDNMSNKHEVRKKDTIPVRLTGDIDEGMLDGNLSTPIGVWRSVGAPKGAKTTSSPIIDVCSSVHHNTFSEDNVVSYAQTQPLQELLDGMALLVQQATSFVDVALDTDPYNWLSLQEQWRRGFSCGPSMVHAGCGGSLASCHSLDIAGVELADPLSVEVHASPVVALLQSDIKLALKSAFGKLDGPLSVVDWCKGHNQSNAAGTVDDGLPAESPTSEYRDSSSTISIGEPVSPSRCSAGGSAGIRVSSSVDGVRMDETSQKKSTRGGSSSESDQHLCSRIKPSLIVLPLPAILVGYQDDWLKTSTNSLQFWEKAPLEPYATQKHMNYYVVCPDIDPLTSAAADFFQQLGTVYETCKLGTHSPQSFGHQVEIDSEKCSAPGFVLVDCPQSVKIESNNASFVASISDYFLSLSNGWDLASFLKSLSKVLKALKIGSCLNANLKEGTNGACIVIYVVCPFPEPRAVLQTVTESSVSIGSNLRSSDKERKSMFHSQVAKALSCSALVDEASISNILTISGFSIPKLVLQVIPVDTIFRVASPSPNELVILKETAFTIYNKARRISRGTSKEVVQLSSSGRSPSFLVQMASPISGMWKDCVGPRITGPALTREGEPDSSLRPGAWENSWQAARSGGLSCDPNRPGDSSVQDDLRYIFEPLFVLAEPGSSEHGVSPTFYGNLASESCKVASDESSGVLLQGAKSAGSVDTGPTSQLAASDSDSYAYAPQKGFPSLHCCYGWTEDWRWLVCIWTDSRGELLDSYIYPFGGISSRQDTKGLQCLFAQLLQQGCQILQACFSHDTSVKPRDFVIARIGCFYELECQEWQKAIHIIGGSEVKKWPLQLRRSMPDGLPGSSNGASLQQQEMSLIQDRTLPSSPNPLYGSHSKSPAFIKNSLGQPATRKVLTGGHAVGDNSKGLLQWVHSISLVSISVDHSLHLVHPADLSSSGVTQSTSTMGSSSSPDAFTQVKSLGSTSASYIFIPSPSMRFLPPSPLQLPTFLTAESPPLAHLLHSKGSAIPFSTGFIASKAVPSTRKDYRDDSKGEWPSVLSVSLVDYYGSNHEKTVRGTGGKQAGRSSRSEPRDLEIETHLILEAIAAELHALSWMTVSPAFLQRRTSLPFHCDMVLRLRRLLHFAEKELSGQPDRLA